MTDSEQVFASYSQNYALPRGNGRRLRHRAGLAGVARLLGGGNIRELRDRLPSPCTPNFDAAVAAYYTTFENRLETNGNFVAGQRRRC